MEGLRKCAVSRVDRLLAIVTVLGVLATGALFLACDDCKSALVKACNGQAQRSSVS
jgi:hypothetical protein